MRVSERERERERERRVSKERQKEKQKKSTRKEEIAQKIKRLAEKTLLVKSGVCPIKHFKLINDAA